MCKIKFRKCVSVNLDRKCLECEKITFDSKNSDLWIAKYIEFIIFDVFIETFDMFIKITDMITEIVDIFTSNLFVLII